MTTSNPISKMSKPEAIKFLNKLEREYFAVGEHLKELTMLKEENRKAILECLDKLLGKDTAGEFVAESGMVLQRLIAETVRYNGKTLEDRLPRDKWLAISTEKRVLDEDKLNMAVNNAKVSIADLVVGKEISATVKLLHKAPKNNK